MCLHTRRGLPWRTPLGKLIVILSHRRSVRKKQIHCAPKLLGRLRSPDVGPRGDRGVSWTPGGVAFSIAVIVLAVNGHVSASTQNQGFHALLFLYQQVLGMELPALDAVRARRPRRVSVALSPEEVPQLLDAMRDFSPGAKGLMLTFAGDRGLSTRPRGWCVDELESLHCALPRYINIRPMAKMLPRVRCTGRGS